MEVQRDRERDGKELSFEGKDGNALWGKEKWEKLELTRNICKHTKRTHLTSINTSWDP